MELEVGKYYRTRNKKIALVLKKTDRTIYPYDVEIDRGVYAYTTDGKHCEGLKFKHGLDIVEELHITFTDET